MILIFVILILISMRKVWITVSFKFDGARRLPPGPKPHWLLGNPIPPPYPWRKMFEWTKEFGPIFTLWQGSCPLIVIGTVEVAKDIMEKMSAITADRPKSFFAAQMASGNNRTLIMGNDDKWKRVRKLLHDQLSPRMATSYQRIQISATKLHILDILQNPDDHLTHAKKYAASVVICITYGKSGVEDGKDPNLQAIHECLANTLSCFRPPPDGFWVNYFPILRYLPSLGWRRKLKGFYSKELKLFKRLFQDSREEMKLGKLEKCFVSDVSEKIQVLDCNQDELAYVGGSMFGAGSDTTAAAISVAVMAAAVFPSKQRKVQSELDRIVGRERSPTFEDWKELPYLEAFVRECFRWRPISAGGFPHAVTESFDYSGFHIPIGAGIVANHWAITRDPLVYPRPEDFQPERFLNEEGTKLNSLPHFTYGFGRRVCAGKEVANRSLFINVAMLLWAFDIKKKIDSSTGEEIDIDTLAFTDTANSHPLPFEVTFGERVPRDIVIREMKSENLL